MNSIDLSIVIPAYKEQENLEFILPQVRATLVGIGCSAEMLVVDTMEPMDETERVCLTNGARYIRRENGNAYGCAIRTGISRAKGEWLVFMDADGSHTPEFISELYKNREGHDVVVASRYVKGGSTDNSKTLVAMSRVVNLVYSIILGLHCKDISNSYKLYRRRDLTRLTLQSDNFDIVEEIIYKFRKSKGALDILELPFSFKERKYGETKRDTSAFIIAYIKTLFRLRFGK